MASTKKTTWLVATGISACVLGLAFIAVIGSQALGLGESDRLILGYSMTHDQLRAGECVARKGSSVCSIGAVNQTVSFAR